MLTIFSTPKAFNGHFDVIQRNAIRSWALLRPLSEIVLFGDDKGTAETTMEFGVCHVPDVARNEYGTPLVNDMFEKARCLATHDLLCYVNADIILMSDFMRAVEQVTRRKRHFLLVGQRWDLDIESPLDFNQPDWESKLKQQVRAQGQLHPPSGIDYFVFPRGLWDAIPPFALGRTAWDQWLIFKALQLQASVIDATQVVCAVHQNHDHSHAASSKAQLWSGEEAQKNRQLAGRAGSYSIVDARWKLTIQGLKINMNRESIGRLIDTWDIMYPGLRALQRPLQATWQILKRTRRVAGVKV